MCMEGLGSVGMKYDDNAPLWVLRAVKAPIMPGILGADRHIVHILIDDIEVFRIQTSQIIRIKHWQPPFSVTCGSGPDTG